MKLKRRKTNKSYYAKKEVSTSEFIPFKEHWDATTLITEKEELVKVIKLDGFAFETADDEDVDIKKMVRNTLWKSIGTGNYALWFHCIRKRKHIHMDDEYDGMFCQRMHEEWNNKHADQETYVNELYVTIIRKKDKSTAAVIEDMMKSLAKKMDNELWGKEMKQNSKDIDEIISRVIGSLKEYNPQLLGIRQENGCNYSEIMEFLGMLVNGGVWQPMLVPNGDISRYLATHRLYFGSNAIEVRSPDNKVKFGGMISIKEYPPYTNACMLDAFLKLPLEYIISQSFSFITRASIINSMSLHQRRMQSAGDKAVSQMEELTLAMDLTQSGQIGFGDHHFSVLVFETELKKLENALSLCFAELVNANQVPYRETYTLQASYWGQIPANFAFLPRASAINTLNLCSFASLHNYPIGKENGNHWGKAVTVLDTTSGTPYFFNFHVRDVGHSTIIGPTGAGKTVLMNFLVAQAQKYKPNMFFFDKDRGAEIFIRAMGGVYNVIEPGEESNFNPLQLEDTNENRQFLEEWLTALVMSSHKQPLTPDESDRIAQAVSGNYKLAKEDRTLTNVAPFLGLEGPGTLAGRLKMWHGIEQRAGLFDNRKDTLDFGQNRIFGFEMGPVLEDKKSLGPVLLYLFHKISLALDGTPTIIVLDEAWALIDNEIFAPKIKDWLKVLRKLNAMVIFATQSVEDVGNSAISDTLVQQTATQIFLANPKGIESSYRNTFMLSNREFQLIKTTDPGSRFFLVKRGNESVVARVDLSGMDDIINVLSGRNSTVSLMHQIVKEKGDNPEVWLPIFWERVKHIDEE